MRGSLTPHGARPVGLQGLGTAVGGFGEVGETPRSAGEVFLGRSLCPLPGVPGRGELGRGYGAKRPRNKHRGLHWPAGSVRRIRANRNGRSAWKITGSERLAGTYSATVAAWASAPCSSMARAATCTNLSKLQVAIAGEVPVKSASGRNACVAPSDWSRRRPSSFDSTLKRGRRTWTSRNRPSWQRDSRSKYAVRVVSSSPSTRALAG